MLLMTVLAPAARTPSISPVSLCRVVEVLMKTGATPATPIARGNSAARWLNQAAVRSPQLGAAKRTGPVSHGAGT